MPERTAMTRRVAVAWICLGSWACGSGDDNAAVPETDAGRAADAPQGHHDGPTSDARVAQDTSSVDRSSNDAAKMDAALDSEGAATDSASFDGPSDASVGPSDAAESGLLDVALESAAADTTSGSDDGDVDGSILPEGGSAAGSGGATGAGGSAGSAGSSATGGGAPIDASLDGSGTGGTAGASGAGGASGGAPGTDAANDGADAPASISVAICPKTTVLLPGETMAFTADVTGAVNPNVYWGIVGGTSGGGSDSGSVDRGTIANDGLYTAPTAPGTYQVVAKSQQSPSQSDTATINVVADGTVQTVRGTIAAMPGAGRIYVTVNEWQGGSTTLLAPGPFVIRGLDINGSPTSVTVKAYRDVAGMTKYLASVDPYGQTTVAWSGTSATGADVTLTAPAAPVFSAGPAKVDVSPHDAGALVEWQIIETANHDEYPQSYRIYASTTPTPGPGEAGASLVKTVRAGFLPSTIVEPLTNGVPYYFAVSGVTAGVESPLSPVAGPITIGSPPGGHVISGTIDVGFTPKGVLYAVVNDGKKNWLERIPGYQASQPFSVTGVPDGRYNVGALVDLDSNGEIDPSDPLTFRHDGTGIPVIVSGSDQTGVSLALPGGDGLASVLTEFRLDGSNAPQYGLRVSAGSNVKQVAKAVLISGPGVVGPIDLRYSARPFSSFDWDLHPVVAPVVGDTFGLEVTYDDGKTCNLDAPVTGVWSSRPTALQPIGADAGTAIPTFTWLAPGAPPPSFTYGINVWETGSSNGDIWFTNLPSLATSILFNDNGSASPAALSSGKTYTWKIQARDPNGNVATDDRTFSVP